MAQSLAEIESLESKDNHVKEVRTVIERIVSKIICKIIENLPVFQPTYQGCQTENDFKKVDIEESAKFCEELSPNRVSQSHYESGSIISIRHCVIGQDIDLGSTENEAALNFHQILSERAESDKSKEILCDQICEEAIDYCEKEQLLLALQLSPISNLKQFKCQERHERETKGRVYFSSPVAEIYEYSERSQTASDEDTQILVDSVSEDFFSSQAMQKDVSGEQSLSDLECRNLDRAGLCLYMIDNTMSAGGDCLNARLNENISLYDTHHRKTNDQDNDRKKRNILSLENKMGHDNPNVLNSTKTSEDKPLTNSEDIQLSQTYNSNGTEKQIKEIEDSELELNKLLELNEEQYGGSIQDITTCSSDCPNVSNAAKLSIDNVNLEKSFKTAQETLMKQAEQSESDENNSIFVSCRNNYTDVLIENRALCVEEEDKSQALFKELNKLVVADFNEESENDDSGDVRGEYEGVIKNSNVENNTLNSEECVLATLLEDFNNTETINENPSTFSDFHLDKIHTENDTTSYTTDNYDVKEVFTKISLEHGDKVSSSQDMFLNGNETYTIKKQNSQFQLKLTSNSENIKNVANTEADITQNNAALNVNFVECYSNIKAIDDIGKIMKDESAEEITECIKKDNIGKSMSNSGNVNDGSDKIIEIHGESMMFQVGKRGQSSPEPFGLSKKSKSDSEKMHTAKARKRKLFGIGIVENRNVKMLKLQTDSIPNHLEDNALTPKMLKQLAKDTLTELEENVIWNSAEVEQEASKKKENDVEETHDKEVPQSIENREISNYKKNMGNFLKKLTGQLEPSHGSLEVQSQENHTIFPCQEAKEVHLSYHKGEADLDVSKYSSRTQDYIEKIKGDTLAFPSETSFDLNDAVDSQNTQESQGFITAMELLSQSSQNSGSTGFVDDTCRNGISDNANLPIEKKGSTDEWLENESSRKLSKKTKSIVEITEDSFKEEKVEDEVDDISISNSVERKNEWDSCRHTVTDQDEQIDTGRSN